jgi:hypothetical protein
MIIYNEWNWIEEIDCDCCSNCFKADDLNVKGRLDHNKFIFCYLKKLGWLLNVISKNHKINDFDVCPKCRDTFMKKHMIWDEDYSVSI